MWLRKRVNRNTRICIGLGMPDETLEGAAVLTAGCCRCLSVTTYTYNPPRGWVHGSVVWPPVGAARKRVGERRDGGVREKRPGLAFECLDRHSTFHSRVGMVYAISRTRLGLCYRDRRHL